MRGTASTAQDCEEREVGSSSSLLGADRARTTSEIPEIDFLSSLTMPPLGAGPSPPPNASDPRLAKLKESSLARRRISIPERNIHNATHERVAPIHVDRDQGRAAALQQPVKPSDVAPPLVSLLSTSDALGILGLDSDPGNSPPVPSSRLQKIQAMRALVLKESPDLTQLTRRLRRTAAQLAFHEMNAQQPPSGRGGNSPPWVPPINAAGSKHKSAKEPVATSSRPQSATARPSSQASALQLKLLLGLQDRLRLKIAFMVLQRAVQVQNLALELIDRAAILEEQEILKQALDVWRTTCLPTTEMLQAAEELQREDRRRSARQALIAWRKWTRQQRILEDRLEQSLQAQRLRLLTASLAHWRLAAGMRHLSMLRDALVAGWVEHWGRRKVFVAWGRVARRLRQHREALLAASVAPPSSTSLHESQANMFPNEGPGSSLFQWSLAAGTAAARAAARSELEGLRACVGDVAREMESYRCKLRWTVFPDPDLTAMDAAVGKYRPDYNPAAYASPMKRQRQQRNPAFDIAEELASELFECKREVERVENECQEIHRRREDVERAAADAAEVLNITEAAAKQAQHAEQAAAEAVAVAQEEESNVKSALDLAIEEAEQHQMRLEECMEVAAGCRAAAEGAATSLASAQEELDSSSSAVVKWRKTVTTAAAQLSRAAANAKSALAVKLKEARRRLELEQEAAADAEKELPDLTEKAKTAELAARQAQAALATAQEASVATAAAKASSSTRYNAAIAATSAAFDALETAQREYTAAEDDYRNAAERVAMLEEERRLLSHRLFVRERELIALQSQAADLDSRHAAAVDYAVEEAHLDRVAAGTAPLSLPQLEPHSWERNVDARDTSFESGNRYPVHWSSEGTEQHYIEGGMSSHQGAIVVVDARTRSGQNSAAQQRSVTVAARHYYRCRLMRKALRAIQAHALLWRELHAAAAYSYSCAHLPVAFAAWRGVMVEAAVADAAACDTLRALSCFRAWATYSARCQYLRNLESEFVASKNRKIAGACFAVLREHAATQQQHRVIIETFTAHRLAAMLRFWRQRSARRRQLQDALDVSLERTRRRTLSSAFQQWRSKAHATALLRRVFSSACERWRLSCGAAGYEAEFALMQRCFAAWQVATHVQLEERRKSMLALAAEGQRERRLLSSAFRALRDEAAWSRERDSYRPLARAALVAWRLLAAASEVHAANAAARHHRDYILLQRAFTAWRGAATIVACRVSVFYLKWQNDWPIRRALQAWRAAVDERKKWEALRAEAEAMRSRHSSPATIASLSPAVEMQRPVPPSPASPTGAAAVSSNRQVTNINRERREVTWVLTSESATRTAATHSSGAQSIGPMSSEQQRSQNNRRTSGEVWQARAEEWRQRQAVYLAGGRA